MSEALEQEHVAICDQPAPSELAVLSAFAEYAGMTDGKAIADGDWAGYVFSGDPSVRAAKAKACQNRAKFGSKNRACRGAMSLYKMLQALGEKPSKPGDQWAEDPEFAEAFGRAKELYIEAQEERLDGRGFEGWEVTKRAGKDPKGRGYLYEKQRVFDNDIAKMRMGKLDPSGYGSKPTVSIVNDNSQKNMNFPELPEGFATDVVRNMLGAAKYASLPTIDVKALPVAAGE